MRNAGPRLALTASAAVSAAAVAYGASTAEAYTVDSYYYLAKARALGRLSGITPNFGGFDRKFFPGYSLALAPFHAALGERGYVLLNVLALVATLVVTFKLGRRVGLSERAAAFGASLACLSPAVVQWAALPMAEPLAALLIASFLLARLRARETGSLRDALGASALYGLAAITRAEAVPLGALLLFDLRRRPLVRHAIPSLLAAAALPAAYALALFVHRTDGGPVSRYSTEIADHRLLRAALVTNFVYHLGAAFDLRFARALALPIVAVAQVLRATATIATLTALVRLRRSALVRALAPPILVGATIHAAWFYQYERFACLWAPETGLLVAWLFSELARGGGSPWRARVAALLGDERARAIGVPAGAVALAACAIAGARSAPEHHRELERDLPSARAAAALFRADPRCDAGVVAAPDPAFAYHVDRKVWFAGDMELFIRSDVPPAELPEALTRTRARCLMTRAEPRAWTARWGLSPWTDVEVDAVGASGPYKLVVP